MREELKALHAQVRHLSARVDALALIQRQWIEDGDEAALKARLREYEADWSGRD